MEKSGEILKLHFWPEKYINISPQYTKRCGIATFEGMFSKKNGFCQYVYEEIRMFIFEITIELDCNLKNKKIQIFS